MLAWAAAVPFSEPPCGQMSDSADGSARRCFDCVLDFRPVQAAVVVRTGSRGRHACETRSRLLTNGFPPELLINRCERAPEWSRCSLMKVSDH